MRLMGRGLHHGAVFYRDLNGSNLQRAHFRDWRSARGFAASQMPMSALGQSNGDDGRRAGSVGREAAAGFTVAVSRSRIEGSGAGFTVGNPPTAARCKTRGRGAAVEAAQDALLLTYRADENRGLNLEMPEMRTYHNITS